MTTDTGPLPGGDASRRWYRRVLADTRPLTESPAFRRLWLGGLLSGFGTRMTAVAVPIQVYGMTHSSLAVGMIGLVTVVPMIVLGLLGGAIADAFDRRRLVLLTGSLLSLLSLLFAAQALADLRQLWLLYALIAVQAALSAVDQPARRVFQRRLLTPARMPAAAALFFLSGQVTTIVGPLVAGVLIGLAGAQLVYLIDAVTFIAALLYSVVGLPAMPPEGSAAGPNLRAVVAGLRYVRHNPIIAGAMLIDLNATIFGMPLALFPALAETRFGGGPDVVGLLYAALAVGGVIASTLSGLFTGLPRQGLAITLAVLVWGIAFIGFGATTVLWVALVLLAVAGAADVVNGVFRNAILQSRAPDVLTGRVNSVGFIVGTGGPQLGSVESGLVASATSPAFSALSGGVLCVVGVVVLAALSPAFLRYDPRRYADKTSNST